MNLYQIQSQFSSEQDYHNHLADLRWSGEIKCTFCESSNIHNRKSSCRFKCKDCGKSFSSTSGTILHNTKLPLSKWFMAISIILNAKKGISSLQLSRTIGVNKNTAWFMQMRLRKAMKEDITLGGLIEVDETYVGGALGNMPEKIKRKKNPYKSGMVHKIAVLGIIERGGKRVLKVIPHANGAIIKPILLDKVEKNSKVITDGFGGYYGLGNHFKYHIKLNHEKRQLKWGRYNLSSVEGFFSTIKRAVVGQYHKLSYQHLQSYMDEIDFKYNNSSEDMFDLLLTRCLRNGAVN